MNDDRSLGVSDNVARSRYELHRGEKVVGFMAYRAEPGTLVLTHTEIDPALEGQGLGSQLVAEALEDIRSRGLAVVPLCPFVGWYLRRHPEYGDLVAAQPVSAA
jgi:predicted GNAT family acetyltransferase